MGLPVQGRNSCAFEAPSQSQGDIWEGPPVPREQRGLMSQRGAPLQAAGHTGDILNKGLSVGFGGVGLLPTKPRTPTPQGGLLSHCPLSLWQAVPGLSTQEADGCQPGPFRSSHFLPAELSLPPPVPLPRVCLAPQTHSDIQEPEQGAPAVWGGGGTLGPHSHQTGGTWGTQPQGLAPGPPFPVRPWLCDSGKALPCSVLMH